MKNIPKLFVAVVVTVFACKKPQDSSPTITPVSQLLKVLESTPQSFSVNAGRDTVIVGTKGTAIHFYANSFKTATGGIITDGKITIGLKEIYKPGDMIANRAPTASADGLLQSGGEIEIIATMNGQNVGANKYGIAFKQNSPSSETMNIYYGNTANTEGVVVWVKGDTGLGKTSSRTKVLPDTAAGFPNYFGSGYFHLFDSCTSFGWANCDKLYNPVGPNTSFKVVIPERSFTNRNTQIFLVLPDKNLMTQSDARQQYDASTNTFTLGNHDNKFPVDDRYIVVAIANVEDKLYYGQNNGIVADGITVSLSPVLETKENIVAKLSALK